MTSLRNPRQSAFFKSIVTLQHDLEEINSLLVKHLSTVSTINLPNIIQLLLNEDLAFHVTYECHIFDFCFIPFSHLQKCFVTSYIQFIIINKFIKVSINLVIELNNFF